jgi:phenylglyoxylate dehydrogenase epsilon subunit
MARKKHLIIGCGHAALSALTAIRTSSPDDEVKLVTRQEFLPYSPASLPYFLSGHISDAELWAKREEDFKNSHATLCLMREVVEVIPAAGKVVFSDGASEHYDTLLIASGSEPAEPRIVRSAEVEMHNLHTLAACKRLHGELQGKKNVVILGAGMVAMKTAAELLQNGYRVSLVEAEERIMPLYFDEEAEIYIRQAFVERNARFFTGARATEISKGAGNRISVSLSDGRELEADLIINAAGVKSSVSFLANSGVRIDRGIVVDPHMRTNVEGVYAAGDVAEGIDALTGKRRIIATIQNAIDQGTVAGANMAGRDVVHQGGILMMVLKFFKNQAVSIGLTGPEGGDQAWKQKDDRTRRFKKLIVRGERLVGGMFVNEEINPGVFVHLIRRGTDISAQREALFEGTRPLSNPWLRPLMFRAPG